MKILSSDLIRVLLTAHQASETNKTSIQSLDLLIAVAIDPVFGRAFFDTDYSGTIEDMRLGFVDLYASSSPTLDLQPDQSNRSLFWTLFSKIFPKTDLFSAEAEAILSRAVQRADISSKTEVDVADLLISTIEMQAHLCEIVAERLGTSLHVIKTRLQDK